MVTVKVIEDSVNENNDRLTTLQLRYPRMVHADFMTHRVFSRNGRSSRAVPVKRLLQEDIYTPVFLENIPGMQGGQEITGIRRVFANLIWYGMARIVKLGVWGLYKLNVHKQHGNRPLEWFGYIDVVVTSSNWTNFIALRDHPDAQPEIQQLARKIKEALYCSTPTPRTAGEWHLPYILDDERSMYQLDELIKLSVARCARVSYRAFDGNDSIEKEFERYSKLIGSVPLHASPAEHQAFADKFKYKHGYITPGWHGNFTGWCQYRKMVPGEFIDGLS